ncbi:MAG: trigger factor [Planctomycetota bacterium]|nr:trigger factor [Planctomycetota bacterium]
MHKAAPLQAEKSLLGPCHWKITLRVPSARIAEEFDHAYRRAASSLKVPGFRPGKVPAHMARQILGDSALEHAREHLFEHVISDAIRAAGLHNEVLRVMGFDPKTQEVDEQKDLDLEFEVETLPEVVLPDWSAIQVERQDARASADQIEEGLRSLGGNHPRFDPAEGAAVGDEHLAVADLIYALDGQDGPEAKDLKVGPGAPLYGCDEQAWEAAVRGRKAGDTFSVEVDFHEGFSEAAWVGKRGTANVTVKSVVTPRVATPTELAEELKLPNEEELRERLGTQIGRENARRERERLAQEILKKVLELQPFELPARMIDEESEAAIGRRVEQMKQQGATEEQAAQAADENRAEMRAASEERLKQWFVIRKVAQTEKVRVSENELDGAVRALALRQNVDPAELRRWFKEEGRIDQLRADILQEKVRAHLVETVARQPEAAPLS